ncbi:hypothetical protein [Pontivivens ytuae]|uniref:Uncharacterized protein n=1 Tax=Pontivivens ytuae TaxID=2789856 RepID=A0A7S9QBF8_9RHOB|nr:hypothetical protein [Pontivivens ytuae]QPH53118.1 hypothetical protein I0K15_15110 [Pontivivens ytuae]
MFDGQSFDAATALAPVIAARRAEARAMIGDTATGGFRPAMAAMPEDAEREALRAASLRAAEILQECGEMEEEFDLASCEDEWLD